MSNNRSSRRNINKKPGIYTMTISTSTPSFFNRNFNKCDANDYKLKVSKNGNLYLGIKNDFGNLKNIYMFTTYKNKVHEIKFSLTENYSSKYNSTSKYVFKKVDICDILMDRGIDYLFEFNDNNYYTFRGDVSLHGYFITIAVSDIEDNYYGELHSLNTDKKINIDDIIHKVNKHIRNKSIDEYLK